MTPETMLVLIALVAGFYLWLRLLASVTIYEFQKGLLYRRGSFVKLLGAGKHYYMRTRSVIEVMDMRKSLVTLPGQEVLTKDNINIKITLAGFYEISDPVRAKHLSSNYLAEFYSLSQILLRDLVSAVTLDALLEKKGEIDTQLLAGITGKAAALGLHVSALSIKDIMLPANLKKAFSGVLEAQKEAQRQLEKARGEQAVLRNLANSSSLYENNPMLLQARLVQALSGGNNSIVFGAGDKAALKEDMTLVKRS